MLLIKPKCHILLFSLLTLSYFDLVAGRNDFVLKGRTTSIRNSAFTRTSSSVGVFTTIRHPSRRFCSKSLKKETYLPQKHGLLVKGVTFTVGFVGGGAAAYWWAQKNHYQVRAKKY